MAENTPYFEAIVADRSLRVDEADAIAGLTTISIETEADLAQANFSSYISENFAEFLKTLRHLPEEDQDLLLMYFVLLKPQSIISNIIGMAQTNVSWRVRSAVRTFTAFIAFGGRPTAENLRPVFEKFGWENELKVPLSQLFEEFVEHRSYLKLAAQHNLRRPDLRRLMRKAADTLMETPDQTAQAVGHYLNSVMFKAEVSVTAKAEEEPEDELPMTRQDPDCLGQFRIRVEDPGFDQMFEPHAILNN